MVIWIKLWGVLLVLHEGFCIDQPYREVQGTTCLEIVKLPNYQTRLTCNQNEQYHCLLNRDNTTEYEVCREWKWIPKGKCAYFNTYGSGNVDERDCDSTSGLTCAPSEYNSADNARYAACYVKKEMTTMSILQTSTRQNVTSDGGNSTSSNSTGSTDRTGQDGGRMAAAIVFGLLVPPLIIVLIILSLRYELWKCAEECKKNNTEVENGENQYQTSAHRRSNERMTSSPTNIPEIEPLFSNENNAGNQQDLTKNKMGKGEEVKLSEWPISEDNTGNNESDKTKGKHNPQLDESAGNMNKRNVTETVEIKEEMNKTYNLQTDSENNENTMHDKVLSKESACCTTENEDHKEKKNQISLMHGKDSSAQNIEEKKLKIDGPSQHADGMVNSQKGKLNNSSVPFLAEANDAEVIANGKGIPSDIVATDEASSENKVSAESDGKGFMSNKQELVDKEEESVSEKEGGSKGEKEGSTGEKEGSTGEKDVSEESAGEKEGSTGEKKGGSTGEKDGLTPEKDESEESIDEKEGSTYTSDIYKTESAGENIRSPVQSPVEDESMDVFDDTVDSLQRDSVDKEDIEFCQKLYEFLNEVCTKPERKLLKSVLSKNAEKSPAEVLNDASLQTELKEELPPEYRASISSEAEDNDSVVILYHLLRKFLQEKDSPKSGWGEPVKKTDTGIGDDVERLHRVYSIIRETSDPGKIPVENYQRLLKVLFDAFTRLDTDEKFKDDRNKLYKKLQDIKNHLWLQKSLSNAGSSLRPEDQGISPPIMM